MEAATPAQQLTTVDCERLKQVVKSALMGVAVPEPDAATVAEIAVRTDMRGVATHGVWLVPAYVEQVRAGGAVPGAEFELLVDKGAVAVADGHANLGMVVAHRAATLAIEKAREHGIAAVFVRHSGHFGAAGHYALMCAEAGAFGMVVSNANPVMQAAGSSERAISNGPTAYGAPRSDGAHFVLDIAMSAAAGQKVVRAAKRGETVPEGWLVDPEGRPTTDPNEWFNLGALVPLGNHKGYGLALVVEVLAGVMAGAAITSDVSSFILNPPVKQRVGHTIIAIDPATFMGPGEYDAQMDLLVERMAGARLAVGAERVILPGQIEHEKEQLAAREGLALDGPTWDRLMAMAEQGSLVDELLAARM